MGIFSQFFKKPINKNSEEAARIAAAQIAEQEKKEEQALAEGLANKLPKICESAAKVFDRDVTGSGQMKDVGICFGLADMFVKRWYLIAGISYSDPSHRVLTVAAEFPDDNRYARPMAGYTMSVRIFTGTKQEILDYLVSQECINELVKTIPHIDKSVKNHD